LLDRAENVVVFVVPEVPVIALATLVVVANITLTTSTVVKPVLETVRTGRKRFR
jgi:hypothetical protein